MKKYFIKLSTISLMTIASAQAFDGIVIVLEAPLLESPDLSSKVLQVLRKGQKIYIPREYGSSSILPEFIPTFDRAGNRAYVPGRYVKVITGTYAENSQPITLAGHDPTDYRLEEPIPVTYPFEDRSFVRASVSLLIGNNTTSAYAYDSAFSKQDYGAETGARLAVTRKVSYDKYDRFYFGFLGLITSSKNTIKFQNENSASESRSIVRAGPWLTYDAFKNEKYRLTIGSGFTFNYHRTTLFVDSGATNEERIFSGFSLSPMTNTTFQISNIFPNTDLVSGVDLSLYLPHSLKTTDTAEIPELWGENNEIKSGFKAQASLFMGIQVKY